MKNLTKDGYKKRMKRIKTALNDAYKNVDDIHIKVQKGNKKTGSNCYTVSLIPVIDCMNCQKCKYNCYDLRNDFRFDRLTNDRCRNSAVHKLDVERYWSEIDLQVKAQYVRELRINVGGDLTYEDFKYVAELGRKNPKTKMLFFTKNYIGINKFLAEGNDFPENVHPILSAWQGMEMENPFDLPTSHVLRNDGTTTAPEYGTYYCGGNCSECAFNEEGCWTLKKGESVIFKEH